MSEYTPKPYITIEDAFDHLGWTAAQIASISAVEKARYINWVREANMKTEAELLPFADEIPLDKTSKVYQFVKSAALNWVVYKDRDKKGSQNARDAKADWKSDIDSAKEMLTKTPTTRTYPIGAKTTDVLSDYLIPYSQTNGLPPSVLY